MEKTVTPIPWRKKPPKHFPCLQCRSGREATLVVTIMEYNLNLCPVCAQLPADVLIPGLGKHFNGPEG